MIFEYYLMVIFIEIAKENKDNLITLFHSLEYLLYFLIFYVTYLKWKGYYILKEIIASIEPFCFCCEL